MKPRHLTLLPAIFTALLISSCCTSFETIRDMRTRYSADARRSAETAIAAARRAQGATPEEPVAITPWRGRDGGGPLPSRAVFPRERAPDEEEPAPDAPFFVTSPSRVGVEGAYSFGRRKDGKLVVIQLVRKTTVEKLEECGCDPGRGTPEYDRMPIQDLYWIRVERPEDVVFVETSYEAREVVTHRPSCGGPPVP